MAEDDGVVLVKKLKATSVVWTILDWKLMKMADKQHQPVCRKCKKSVPAMSENTSNLMSHLKEHHSDLHVEALTEQKNN